MPNHSQRPTSTGAWRVGRATPAARDTVWALVVGRGWALGVGGWELIKAAIVGMGWWGRTVVESVQSDSDVIRFVAGATRTVSPEVTAFAEAQTLTLAKDFNALLANKDIDAVVLATPHSQHTEQVIAAAQAGKHVFCEKPFALTKADADAAVAATRKAGVTLGLGYNRRFHPEMTSLREKIRSGDLGTVLHFEATMTFPNALSLKPEAWRADREETPCGGLTPMGVHAIDGMIDLGGEIDQVFCQSFRRVVQVDSDDTTSMLFRMKNGASGYLGTITATGPGFSFQVFGSKGSLRLEGMTHVAGASSEERRTRLFSTAKWQPIKGPAETWEAARLDVTRACLEAFGTAAAGGPPFLIPTSEMIHGAAVTEAVVKSAASGKTERIEQRYERRFHRSWSHGLGYGAPRPECWPRARRVRRGCVADVAPRRCRRARRLVRRGCLRGSRYRDHDARRRRDGA